MDKSKLEQIRQSIESDSKKATTTVSTIDMKELLRVSEDMFSLLKSISNKEYSEEFIQECIEDISKKYNNVYTKIHKW